MGRGAPWAEGKAGQRGGKGRGAGWTEGLLGQRAGLSESLPPVSPQRALSYTTATSRCLGFAILRIALMFIYPRLCEPVSSWAQKPFLLHV